MLDYRLPTLVDYYKQFVDSKVDLSVTTSIPCHFHKETHGRSFSVTKDLSKWRCFGACHCGGDVIDLHRLNMRLRSREEALQSLYALYHIPYKEEAKKPEIVQGEVNEAAVSYGVAYSEALCYAKTVDDWIELDYIMSQFPVSEDKLKAFVNMRKE